MNSSLLIMKNKEDQSIIKFKYISNNTENQGTYNYKWHNYIFVCLVFCELGEDFLFIVMWNFFRLTSADMIMLFQHWAVSTCFSLS